MSAEHHLHWEKTGKTTWKLRLAQVQTGRYAGSVKLSDFRLNVRVLKYGRVQWGEPYDEPRTELVELPVKWSGWRVCREAEEYWVPAVRRRIEKAFQAKLAARALAGTAERYVRAVIVKPCTRCPPAVAKRRYEHEVKRGTAAAWHDWAVTESDLRSTQMRLWEQLDVGERFEVFPR